MTNQTATIKINPKRILIGLLVMVLVIVGLSIWGQKIRFFGVADIRGPWHEYLLDLLMQAFYLDAEGNVPIDARGDQDGNNERESLASASKEEN